MYIALPSPINFRTAKHNTPVHSTFIANNPLTVNPIAIILQIHTCIVMKYNYNGRCIPHLRCLESLRGPIESVCSSKRVSPSGQSYIQVGSKYAVGYICTRQVGTSTAGRG